MTPPVMEQAGSLWTWWIGDDLPALSTVSGLTIAPLMDSEPFPQMPDINRVGIEKRRLTQHRPWIAWIGSIPVAYGMSGSGETHFGSPAITFTVPPRNRYLCDFMTVPAWRGQGIYPRILQAILAQETQEAERFWILHHIKNRASARGIEKAGFHRVADVYFLPDTTLALRATGSHDHALSGAHLLGLPLLLSDMIDGDVYGGS